MRSDNGGEYIDNELKEWCKQRGTVLDYTPPYTPQLNGKAERLNRTLTEKVRALLKDGDTSKKMWGEAVRTAAYLLNRSPTEALDTTPFEKWNSVKPDLSRLQFFGCDAHAKDLTQLKKLDDRSKKFTFVGYAPNGYRLYTEIKGKGKIIISRDVKFSEMKKPERNLTRNKTTFEDDSTEEIEAERDQEEERRDIEEQIESSEEEEDDEIQFEDARQQIEEQEEYGRGKRAKRPPVRLNDYVYLTYEEAITGPEKENWKKAIEEEKKSLEENKTWKIVDRSEAKNNKIISNKWVFKLKDDGRYKARLVIRGCEQRYGMDYEETFSPVVNSSSLRTLLAVANKRKDNIVKFDIKTAFLYGSLDEEIFMELPEGYKGSNKICKLQKALYGLKQAPLQWNHRFTTFLTSEGLQPLETEPCIYNNEDNSLTLAIYVDDGLLIGQDKKKMKRLLDSLGREFKMTTFPDPKSFLGIELEQTAEYLRLKQPNFATQVVKKFKMENSKPASTPMLANDDRSDETTGNFPYRESVGSLLYLANKTRPDLAYSVGFASRHLENPTGQDITNVKRILRYVNETVDLGIKYQAGDCTEFEELVCYTDSDFAGDPETRKSTTGYVILYCGGPISWCSRKQPIIALSSTEAEFIAAAECCKEVLYIKSLIEELTNKIVKIELNVDNQSSKELIKNGVGNKRSKHIDVRYRFITAEVRKKAIALKYCPTDAQLADIFTKALGSNKFVKHRNNLVT